MASARVRPSTRFWEASTRPALSRHSISARIPPARPTSSTWYFAVLGATLHRQGTLRDRASMSSIVKSTPASAATASRWSTVLVEPPIATSSAIAFRNACLVAMLRGRTLSSPSS